LGHDSPERFLAVPGLGHLVTGIGEEIAKDLPIILVILHHQNALAHVLPTCVLTLIGRVKKKVAPSPSLDSTQSLPPCISTIHRAMDKPSPVPAFFFVADESTC